MEIYTLVADPLIDKALEEISICHKSAFPKQFLSRMGIQALIGFYKENLSQHAKICVAYENNRLVGFVSGGAEDIIYQYRRKVLRENPIKFARSLFSIEVVHSAMHIILRILIHSDDRCKMEIPANYNYLSVIAVREDFRGKDIAGKLVDLFEKECLTNNYSGYYLNVNSHNDRAIAFYKKKGLEVLSSDGNSTVMSKSLVS